MGWHRNKGLFRNSSRTCINYFNKALLATTRSYSYSSSILSANVDMLMSRLNIWNTHSHASTSYNHLSHKILILFYLFSRNMSRVFAKTFSLLHFIVNISTHSCRISPEKFRSKIDSRDQLMWNILSESRSADL